MTRPGRLDQAFRIPQRVVRAMAGVALPPRHLSEALRERWRLVQLLSLAPRWVVAVSIAGNLLAALAPAALALAVGGLVGVVIGGAAEPAELTVPIVLFAGALLAQRFGQLVAETGGVVVTQQIDRRVRHRVRALALADTRITSLQDADYQDELHRASNLGGTWRVRSPGTATVGQLLLVFRLLAAVMAASVVAHFSIVLALLLLVTALMIRAVVRTQWMELAALADRLAPEQRRVAYLTDLATTAPAAKEIRIFGLGEWVTTRRHTAELNWFQQVWRVRSVVYGRQVWVLALAAGFALVAMLGPSIAVLQSMIDVGQLATYLTAAWSVFAIASMGYEAYDIEHGIGAVRALDRLDARGGGAAATTATAELPDPHRPPLVEFVQVQFSYPGGGPPVLAGLDAEVRPGEVVALVGANGAGKTSLVKLLAGLLEPTGGTILVAGRDLSTIDPVAWRRRLKVLFQDFIRYPLTAEQNVLLGAGDQPPDRDALHAALRDAGAEDLLRRLPDQQQTFLTRLRTGGVDLSGGQWQRIALARVLYAFRLGAQILVLDEPTAHLDVPAEANFFDEVVQAATGASVVLISHRLSTVRRADRILLLSGGRITEAGDHDALVASGGEYARLFRLQAQRFRADAPDTHQWVRR